MELTVTILSYHEAENLKWLLPELKKIIDPLHLESVEYLIIDSSEPTDDTPEFCREFGARYINQEEPGYGGAYRTAIRYASKELFLNLDADGSQDYTKIPAMYQEILAGADVAVGSRYVPGGSTSDSKSSQAMSAILNTAFRVGAGIKVRDMSGSFRICYTRDLQQLHLTAENFDILEEILLKLMLTKKGLVISEVPISFNKRIIGESKRSLCKFIICFGQMLIYLSTLRILAGRKYFPEEHDAKAWRITELLLYGIVGVMTTVINIVIYFLLDNVIGYMAANMVAWFLAVIFAYATNKTIVFNNWDWRRRTVNQEFRGFIGSRIITGVLDMAMLWTMVDILTMENTIAKIIDSIVVIILNYILSKYFVFKNSNPSK